MCGGVLHGGCCVTVTLLPFLAFTVAQSSCNPRSFIHNSGCGSLTGGRGKREGGSRLLCPQAGLEWALQAEARQGRGLGEHLSLPPLSSTLLLVSFFFFPHPPSPAPLFTRLFTATSPPPPPGPQLFSRLPYARPGQAQCARGGRGGGGILNHSRIIHCETENITEGWKAVKLASGWVEPFLSSESGLLPSPAVKGEGGLLSLTLGSSLPLKSAGKPQDEQCVGPEKDSICCGVLTVHQHLLTRARCLLYPETPPTCRDPWGEQ